MKIQTISGKIYPLTIISDRYNGCYSNGKYVAFNLDFEEIPEGVTASDMEACSFWDNIDIPFGLGDTPNGAMQNMLDKYEQRQL